MFDVASFIALMILYYVNTYLFHRFPGILFQVNGVLTRQYGGVRA